METEYELCPEAFSLIRQSLGCPIFDLFASRLNAKCTRYASWKCDPGAEKVDTFTVIWSDLFFYAFPPFSLILRVLQRIIRDKAEGIVVVPFWPSQPWFPLFQALLIAPPVFLPPSNGLLFAPNRQPHPLWKTLTLAAGHLSGRRC